MIHLLAEQSTLEGASNSPGYLPGFGVQPAEVVRDLAATATVTPVVIPGGQAEAGYRPSVALAEFIDWRDLTCRWPGCDAPVDRCDIDHTVPFPFGRTQGANLKNYCRTHHLIKTFYCGPGGWTEQQLADGTIVVTAPTGHRYSSAPGGALLFPVLATPTGQPAPAPDVQHSPGRGLAMPTRQQTRDQDRRSRRDSERRQRAAINAELARQREIRIAQDLAANPPPF